MLDNDKIIEKIKQIENLLKEIKKDLKKTEKKVEMKNKVDDVQKKELIKDYEKLYNEFLLNGSQPIIDFVKNHSKDYLKIFCKINNLTISSKASKEKIIKEISQWFKQRKAITQKVEGGN